MFRFYNWFFRDSMVFSSTKLDEGSKRLAKLLSLLAASPSILFLAIILLNFGFYTEDPFSQLMEESMCFLIFAGFFLIVSWLTYRITRAIFWLIDGFFKSDS